LRKQKSSKEEKEGRGASLKWGEVESSNRDAGKFSAALLDVKVVAGLASRFMTQLLPLAFSGMYHGS